MKLILLVIYVVGVILRARKYGADIAAGRGPRMTKWNEMWEEYPDSSARDIAKWRKNDLADMRFTANLCTYFWPAERVWWLWCAVFGRLPELLAPKKKPAEDAEPPITDGKYR